jgi:vacuolar-type H+-ATPase subunit E/Vma4
MKPLGSVAAVIAAIREDAAAEAEAAGARAAEEVAHIRALQAGDVVTIADRESRLAAARREAQVRLAQADWEDRRDAVAVREEWLERATEVGRRLLATRGDDAALRARLTALVVEGAARLPGRTCEVVVSEADAALLGPDWRRDVAAAAGRDDVQVTSGPIDGGCIVRTLDGRASFDNTYATRARRFQPAWRASLAEIYEQALSAASWSQSTG